MQVAYGTIFFFYNFSLHHSSNASKDSCDNQNEFIYLFLKSYQRPFSTEISFGDFSTISFTAYLDWWVIHSLSKLLF